MILNRKINKNKQTKENKNTIRQKAHFQPLLYVKLNKDLTNTNEHHCATLIDNTFTNFENNTASGLLINDISDHLPMFTV